MPHISVLKSSKFLTKADVDPPVLVTIKDCIEYNVAKEGAPEEHRWCLTFNELDKPMVLNSTNGQIIAGFLGKENTDEWRGHKVVLYNDPSVSFGGKLIGGIRVRAPRTPKSPVPAPVAVAHPHPMVPSPTSGAQPWPNNPGEVVDDVPF